MAGNMTGRKLSSRYLIGERIGIGGMAEVYQGQDTVLGRTVAVKIMLPQYAEDATFVKNAGKDNMEIIVKKNNKITRYKSEKSTGSGRGRRVGIAYQLESG